jgi:flagellar biosynthesis protein FlhG
VARLEHVIHPAPTIDAGHRHVREIVMDAPGGFRLVPGSAGVARMADLGPDERKLLLASINHLAAGSDVLVIDTAAGVGPCVTSFMETADLSLVIATPEPTSIADAYSLVKCLVARRSVGDAAPGPRHSHPLLGLIVNQVVDAKEARAVHARIAGTCLKFLGVALPLTGWVLHDIHVSEAVRARKPLLLHDPICQASHDLERVFRAVAQHIGLNPVPPSAPASPLGGPPDRAQGPIICAGRPRRRGLRGLFRRQLPG